MDLAQLEKPFPAADVEWRVSRSGIGGKGIWCRVLAYITHRAIQKRLDAVCGPENWRNEEPKIIPVGKNDSFACGLSIRIGEEWVTKWDVCEPTAIEPAKGGWSGAMKRAGSQWGIGRYLYHLDETFADVSEVHAHGYNYAKVSNSGEAYYWKPPTLPGWALPDESDSPVSESQLNKLKKAWRDKYASDVQDRSQLLDGFTRFVRSVVGDFPIADSSCWTHDVWTNVLDEVNRGGESGDVSDGIPFG